MDTVNWGKIVKEGHLEDGSSSPILCFNKDIHEF